MQDLKDVTNNVHYENYRSRKLAAVTYNGVDNNRAKAQLSTKLDTVEGISPLAQMEEEWREHVSKMKTTKFTGSLSREALSSHSWLWVSQGWGSRR